MAPRAYWKGYLKLSLVSCPIALNPATSSSERVSFRQINKKTGHRLRQQLVDDETRELVDSEDRGKGYEIGKNEFLLIEDNELEALEVESNHTIDIDSFVPAAQIDKRFYDSPYYIMPSDKVGQEAFAVIRDAMKGKGMVALGRVVVLKRERVIALEPHGKGLLGTTLHYPYEVRKSEEYFDEIPDIKVADEMLKLAEHILETKTGDLREQLVAASTPIGPRDVRPTPTGRIIIEAVADEIGSQHRQTIQAAFRETPFNPDVPAHGKSSFTRALLECSNDVRRIRARARTEISDGRHRRGLSPEQSWPGEQRRRTAAPPRRTVNSRRFMRFLWLNEREPINSAKKPDSTPGPAHIAVDDGWP
jgi:Ku protein